MHYNPDEIEKIKQSARKDFPQRLKKLREVSGLSQDAFAKALGVSRAAIGYYENGERLPDISFLATLYDRTGCNLKYLLGYADTLASYEYFNFASEYDLNDDDMKNLKELLDSNTFKNLLSNKSFADFFQNLDYLCYSLSHDERTRAIVEYVCVSSLSQMIGQAFFDFDPMMRRSPELEELTLRVQEDLISDISNVIQSDNIYDLKKDRAELLKTIHEEAKDDPFYKLKRYLKDSRKDWKNGKT